MKIELNEGATTAFCALVWAVVIAVILCSFASCAAREAEAKANANARAPHAQKS